MNAPIHMTIEIFLILCNQIQNSEIFKNEQDLEFSIEKDSGLLKRLRLLNQMMLEIPMFWVRLPDGLLKDFVESTFKFLWKADNQRTPFSLLCMIDFEAKWFGKWFISCYGRNLIVPALKEYDIAQSITRRLVQNLDRQISILQVESEYHPSADCIDAFSISFLECIHLITICGKLLCFAQGRLLFPLEASINKGLIKSQLISCFFKNDSKISLSISECLELMLKLMVECHIISKALPGGSCDNDHPSLNRAICDIFKDISSASLSTRQILYNVSLSPNNFSMIFFK